MQPSRNSVWLWTLIACNGIAATALHVALTGAPSTSPVGLFQVAATLAHFSALAALLGLLPWAAIRAGAPNAIALGAAVATFGTFVMVVIVNAMVYALYKFHLNTMVWYLLTQGAAQQTLSFSSQTWGGAASIVAAVYVAETALAVWLQRLGSPSTRSLVRYGALLLSLGIVTQLFTAYADATARRDVSMAVRTVPWAQPLTAKSFFARWGIAAARADSPTLAADAPTTFNYPLAPLHCTPASRPNVLMLVVDSLRFDMLNDAVMPATSNWARGAIRFERHYSTGNGTRFGIFGLMYGLPGAYWHAALAERRGPVLIDQLDALGYQFFIFGSAPLDSPEFHRTAFTRVWDRVALTGPGDVVARDRAVTNGLVEAIRHRNRERPFFGFLFLDAPHAYAHPDDIASPFEPRLESVDYLALDNDFDPLPFLNAYKTSVWFDDGLLERVLQTLDEDPTLSNTIVLVTGDHGQAFNETHDNTWGHNSAFSDYQVRVPFVVRWPDRPAGSVDRPTSHVDWAPTLLTDALGCTTPIDRYSTGARLFDEAAVRRNLPIEQWTQRAIRTDDRVYVFLSWGGYEVRDENYAMVEEPVNAAALREGFEQLSRFTRR